MSPLSPQRRLVAGTKQPESNRYMNRICMELWHGNFHSNSDIVLVHEINGIEEKADIYTYCEKYCEWWLQEKHNFIYYTRNVNVEIFITSSQDTAQISLTSLRTLGLFSCPLFSVPSKNLMLIWRRYNCRWRAAKFKPTALSSERSSSSHTCWDKAPRFLWPH